MLTDFMLLVNGKLLIVKFWGVKSYTEIFDQVGESAPQPPCCSKVNCIFNLSSVLELFLLVVQDSIFLNITLDSGLPSCSNKDRLDILDISQAQADEGSLSHSLPSTEPASLHQFPSLTVFRKAVLPVLVAIASSLSLISQSFLH